MSRTDRALIAIALILLLLTTASILGFDRIFGEDEQVDVGDSIAEVVDGRGDMRVKFSKQFQWQKGRVNQKLVYDDAVFSGENSQVDLKIGDSKLKLDSNTLVVLRQQKRFKTLNLSRGMLSGLVAKNEQLHIETAGGEKIELSTEEASNVVIERKGSKTSVKVTSGNARVVKDGKAQNLGVQDKIEFVDSRPQKNDPIRILTPERTHVYSRDARVGLDFTWGYSSGNTAAPTDEFFLEFSLDPTFSKIAMREVFSGQTRFSTSLTVPQVLFFRVKDNRGNFSVTCKLALLAPDVPIVVSPKAGSEIFVHRGQEGQVIFSINPAQTGGNLRLQVGKDREFNHLVVDEIMKSRQLAWKLPTGDYFVKARSEFESDQVFSDWSGVVPFSVKEKVNPLDIKRANLPSHVIIPNLNYPSSLYGSALNSKRYLAATSPFVEFFNDLTFAEHILKAKRRDVDSESVGVSGSQFPAEWIDPGLIELVYHVESPNGTRFPSKMHRMLIEMAPPNRLTASPSTVLSWSPILFARAFEVEVKPENGLTERFTVDKSWFQPVLQPDTPHTYRVRALGTRGPISAWSSTHRFRTPAPPPEIIQSQVIEEKMEPQRKPAQEETPRPPSTSRLKGDQDDPSLWEKIGGWFWGGSGVNYVNVRQTIANTADVEYKNTKGPSAYLEAGWLGRGKFGGVVSFKRTPGDIRVDNYPVNKRGFTWTTTSAEGLWLTPWHTKLWRMPVVWTVRAGVQNHSFPFLYIESGNEVIQATNNMLTATVGFIAETLKNKFKYYWSMRYQQPLSSGSEGGNSFTVTPILAFDGSVGASYNFTDRWKLGTFWYGQLHSYNFNYASSSQQNAGVQNLFYSNFELRVGIDF